MTTLPDLIERVSKAKGPDRWGKAARDEMVLGYWGQCHARRLG